MTEAYTFDGSRSQFGSRLAVLVAVVASVLMGATTGYLVQTVVGVLGGLLFGLAARDLESDALRERVRGSVLLLATAVLIVAAVVAPKATLSDAVLVSMVPAAVGTTTVAATTTVEEAGIPVLSALGRTFLVTAGGTLLAGALAGDVFSTLAVSAWGAFTLAVSNVAFAGFVALQIELLVIGLVAGKAGRAANELDPGGTSPTSTRMGVRDVPLGVWMLIAIQVLVLAVPGGPAFFEYLLGLTGPIGGLLASGLTSVVLHGALTVLAGLLVLLPAVQLGRSVTVKVVGTRPPKTFAYVAGGVAFVGVVIAFTSIPGAVSLVRWVAQRSDAAITAFDSYGVAPAVIGGVTGVLAITAVFVFVLLAVTGLSVVPDRATWFAFAAGTLFVAASAAALSNAPAPAVFVGLASALLVWDLGEYATTIGGELGDPETTKPPEIMHAVVSIGVAALAVTIASLATHFLVPRMTAIPAQRASTALGLVAVSIVAFAYLAYTADDTDS